MEAITSFDGKYDFLDNCYPCHIPYQGVVFPSVEHAFQASKTFDLSIRQEFAKLTAKAVKERGKRIPLRPDWDSVRIKIMEELCLYKFKHDMKLCNLLLSTGDRHIEYRHPTDKFWGVTPDGGGMNKLGFILMRVRSFYMRQSFDISDKATLLRKKQMGIISEPKDTRQR